MRGDVAGFIARTNARPGLVVVAPHPDDESAGCGGLIAGCRRRGVPVRIVQLTDGAASHRSEQWPPRRLAVLRAGEMDRAARSLGVQEAVVRLGFADAGRPTLQDERSASRRLADMILRWRPGLVLTTWRREPHCDHQLAYRIARCACDASGTALAEYLVWTPITGRPPDRPDRKDGVPFDIVLSGEERKAKRRALGCHESQRGRIVTDDPTGFVLTPAVEVRMTGPFERYVLP